MKRHTPTLLLFVTLLELSNAIPISVGQALLKPVTVTSKAAWKLARNPVGPLGVPIRIAETMIENAVPVGVSVGVHQGTARLLGAKNYDQLTGLAAITGMAQKKFASKQRIYKNDDGETIEGPMTTWEKNKKKLKELIKDQELLVRKEKKVQPNVQSNWSSWKRTFGSGEAPEPLPQTENQKVLEFYKSSYEYLKKNPPRDEDWQNASIGQRLGASAKSAAIGGVGTLAAGLLLTGATQVFKDVRKDSDANKVHTARTLAGNTVTGLRKAATDGNAFKNIVAGAVTVAAQSAIYRSPKILVRRKPKEEKKATVSDYEEELDSAEEDDEEYEDEDVEEDGEHQEYD